MSYFWNMFYTYQPADLNNCTTSRDFLPFQFNFSKFGLIDHDYIPECDSHN